MQATCALDGDSMVSRPPDSFPGPEDDVERKKRESISARIEERLKELGTNAKTASRAAGLGATYVHEVCNGRIKNPPREKIERIAKVLRCSIEYLEGMADTPYPVERPIRSEGRIHIPVIGYIEPDTFRKMTKDRHEARAIDYSLHPQYPHAKHFALDVRGDDMDACRPRGRLVPICEGMTVVYVDLASAGIPVENGNIYVVERYFDGGRTGERLLRRASVFVDHIELKPESTDPDRPSFTIPRDMNRINEIKVIGLVYAWFYDYLR